MNMSRKRLRDNLAAQLRGRLKLQCQGKIPSAAMFARLFNLRVEQPGIAVTPETARRWLRGESFPDETRLSVLTQWLSLDLQSAFSQSVDTHPKPVLRSSGMQPVQGEIAELLAQTNTVQQVAFLNLLRVITFRSERM